MALRLQKKKHSTCIKIDIFIFPDFPFNCMGWNASTQSEFVADFLGPALDAAGYGDLALMIFDDQARHTPQSFPNQYCHQEFSEWSLSWRQIGGEKKKRRPSEQPS